MEIQWMILALGYFTSEKSEMMSIVGLVHRVNLSKYDGKEPLCMIAKINMMPHEASEKKILKLEVIHGNESKTYNVSYTLPSWDIWLAEYVPYIAIRLRNLCFPELGEYIFRISVDGELKNEETIIAYYGG